MTTAQFGTLLLYLGAPGATLFVTGYILTAPWFKSLIGWAIVISKIGLAGLVDLALLYRFLGPTYPYHDQAILGSFALIVVGTYLYLAVLVREQIQKRRR